MATGPDPVAAAIAAVDGPEPVAIARFEVNLARGRQALIAIPVDLTDGEFAQLASAFLGAFRQQLIVARQQRGPQIAIARAVPPKLKR